jgi:hypothetical protein
VDGGLPVEEEVSSSLSAREPLVSFYPVMPPDVILRCAEEAVLGLLGQAGVVAVRVTWPRRRSAGWAGMAGLR